MMRSRKKCFLLYLYLWSSGKPNRKAKVVRFTSFHSNEVRIKTYNPRTFKEKGKLGWMQTH